jgi:hypothetical protein
VLTPDVRSEGIMFGVYYFSLPVGALAVALGARGFWLRSRARATLGWRPVEGTVTWSSIDSRDRRGRHGAQWVDYRPDIKYAYQLSGRDYLGSRVYFGAHEWKAKDSSFADELVGRYPVNSTIRVFVDPKRPDESVLERGREGIGRRYLMGSAFLATMVLLAFMYGISQT